MSLELLWISGLDRSHLESESFVLYYLFSVVISLAIRVDELLEHSYAHVAVTPIAPIWPYNQAAHSWIDFDDAPGTVPGCKGPVEIYFNSSFKYTEASRLYADGPLPMGKDPLLDLRQDLFLIARSWDMRRKDSLAHMFFEFHRSIDMLMKVVDVLLLPPGIPLERNHDVVFHRQATVEPSLFGQVGRIVDTNESTGATIVEMHSKHRVNCHASDLFACRRDDLELIAEMHSSKRIATSGLDSATMWFSVVSNLPNTMDCSAFGRA